MPPDHPAATSTIVFAVEKSENHPQFDFAFFVPSLMIE
jgi:hypothetical protein